MRTRFTDSSIEAISRDAVVDFVGVLNKLSRFTFLDRYSDRRGSDESYE